VQIRPEQGGDASAISALHWAAFGAGAEAGLVAATRAAGAARISLVAALDVEVVGHILLSEVEVVGAERWPVLALAPMAVRPEHQRQGIGSALVRAALAAARARPEPLVVVLGHPSYYPRFGFEPARGLGVEPPFPVRGEAFMALALPAYDPSCRGIVRYPPAFDGV
jgi:putative acetyltransferase